MHGFLMKSKSSPQKALPCLLTFWVWNGCGCDHSCLPGFAGWTADGQKSSEWIASISFPAEGAGRVSSWNSCSETSSLCSRSEGECREVPLGQKDCVCVYACVCVFVCMQKRQIYRRRRRGAESWEERKAAGLIRSYPLNRGSTWIGWIVENSEAVGVARALLCVHQFQINPAASVKVSLSHMLNPFLFRDALSCCWTPNRSEFVPATHIKLLFLCIHRPDYCNQTWRLAGNVSNQTPSSMKCEFECVCVHARVS